MATNKKRFYTVGKSWYWEKDWKDKIDMDEFADVVTED